MPLEQKDATRLSDMLRHAQLAKQMIAARTLDEFKADIMVQLAVVRCIEIIGEAGHQVSAPIQATMPTVPWHRMWSMRNRLIHDYGHTDLEIVYHVVVHDLDTLITVIKAQTLPPV
jgi:uncharacterized protein with HEPN domain